MDSGAALGKKLLFTVFNGISWINLHVIKVCGDRVDGGGYDVLCVSSFDTFERKVVCFQVRISIFLVCDLGELIL